MNNKEIHALRTILLLTPWKRDRVSKEVGKYLDGKIDNIKGLPTLQAIIDEALETLSEAKEARQ